MIDRHPASPKQGGCVTSQEWCLEAACTPDPKEMRLDVCVSPREVLLSLQEVPAPAQEVPAPAQEFLSRRRMNLLRGLQEAGQETAAEATGDGA